MGSEDLKEKLGIMALGSPVLIGDPTISRIEPLCDPTSVKLFSRLHAKSQLLASDIFVPVSTLYRTLNFKIWTSKNNL